ncbi:MAG: hypothetical protein HKN22_08905 [Bacteroidia bacterium]|nr:hypothetical protein [Bacteroidia bacterium]
MNITLKTKVKGNYKDIMAAFDRNLFEALKPKNADMEIIAFTGSKKGDKVHLRFNSPIKAEWISDIVEDGANADEAWFIDEGSKLPAPLKYWRHKHIVKKISQTESEIIDDITYKSWNPLMTLLIYPGIYLGFWPRKSVYREYFS